MRLMTKTAAIIAAALSLATIANVVLIRTFIEPTFHDLDRGHANEDHKRARDAIATDLKSIADKTQDWSHWDDLYLYGEGKSPNFPRDNLQAEHMANMGLATGVLISRDFRILYQVNAEVETAKALPAVIPGTELPQGLRAKFGSEEFVAKPTVIAIGGQLHLAAIAPIVRSDGSGPPSGYLVFMRPVNNAYVAALGDRIEVDVALQPPQAGALRGTQAEAESKEIRKTETDDSIDVSSALADLSGAPAMNILTKTPRDVKKLGDTVLLWTSLGLVVIGVLAICGGAAMMRAMVIGPVARIVDHMVRIGRTADLSVKLDDGRRDEIGALAKQLNKMADDLDSARKTLIDQTYASGMSEMAADVLHNIRNAMNPIAVRMWGLNKTLKEGLPENLKRAIGELADGAIELERRRKLGEYATSAIDEIQQRRDTATKELAEIVTCSRHIEDILRDFDSVSLGPRTFDGVAIDDLLRSAQALIGASGRDAGRAKLTIDPALRKLPEMRGNRVVLQQVVGNLIKNAEEAIARGAKSQGAITIAGRTVHEAGTSFVEISVTDDGAGIERERLEKIFARGHSSNAGGNRGLGLHWCANSIKTMGGSIAAFSEGPGRGATFTFRIPSHRSVEGEAA